MSEIEKQIDLVLERAPVIPVLVIDDVADAAPLAEALVAGGLGMLEITLRTPAALDAIAAMAEVEGALVGAGTLTRPGEFAEVAAAGARFAVSPGFLPALSDAAAEAGLFYLPGVATASEVLAAKASGHSFVKFFPAEAAGGTAMLNALAGPYPEVCFCPTGGITATKLPEYLQLANVRCVGGAWVAPRKLVQEKDWAGITALAREAADIGRRLRP